MAVTCLVGNCVGAGKIVLAKRIGRLGIGCACAIELIIGVFVLMMGRYLIEVFSTDIEVITIATSVIPFVTISAIVYTLQGVGQGVIRGAGKQTLGAILNIIAYYIVGLPLAWIFCFNLKFDLIGLTLGMSIGSFTQASVLFSLVFIFTNYLYTDTVTHRSTSSSSNNNISSEIEFTKLSTTEDNDLDNYLATHHNSSNNNNSNNRRS